MTLESILLPLECVISDSHPESQALHVKSTGRVAFKEGTKALKILNDHLKTLPYLHKDPRMCIALPTWLQLLDDKPAVVFTYRHPLEAAMSLKHREQNFTIESGLRLWIVYNMRAVQNSAKLCRVYSTNDAIFNDPMDELQRIKDELTDKCHVMPPPVSHVSQTVVDSFVDPKFQHNSKERERKEEKLGVLKDFGENCVVHDFDSKYEEGSSNREAKTSLCSSWPWKYIAIWRAVRRTEKTANDLTHCIGNGPQG